MKTLWQSLEAEINRRGIEAVTTDIELLADQLADDIAEVLDAPVEVSEARDPQFGGSSRASLAIRITNELLDAYASARRAARIARYLAEMPPNKGGPIP